MTYRGFLVESGTFHFFFWMDYIHLGKMEEFEATLNHIKFRYTFLPHLQDAAYKEEFQDALKGLASLFIEKMDPLYVSTGIEDLDKFGEHTHLHLHIHCVTSKKVDAIRKAVQKVFKELEDPRKGTALYGLSQVKDCLDQKRLLRYPFKQSRRGLGSVSWTQELDKYPVDFDYCMERELAIEEWERLVVVNRQKRERALNPNTFEKFEEYMTDKEVITLGDIAGHIHDFYMKERMSMNLKTMGGYVRTFAVSRGIITREVNVVAILQNV